MKISGGQWAKKINSMKWIKSEYFENFTKMAEQPKMRSCCLCAKKLCLITGFFENTNVFL